MGGWHHLGCIHCSCQPFAASPEGLGTVTIPSSALGRSLCRKQKRAPFSAAALEVGEFAAGMEN